MRDLLVFIEIEGTERFVGNIRGNSQSDAVFAYADEYLHAGYARPVSISLPLSEKSFDPVKTRCFFDGLLPEGFTRRSVAKWLRSDEDDYLTMLSGLGMECLGAIKIVEDGKTCEASDYRLLPLSEVQKIAAEGAVKSSQIMTNIHLSLAGASGKVGLMYDEANLRWYLPIGDAPSTHILKQSHVRLDSIVVNEQLCMMTASRLGIDTPESFIVNTGDFRDEDVLFATKRYDRDIENSVSSVNDIAIPLRLHQEDFAQALGISSAEKYENEKIGYLKKMFDLIRQYSADPIVDITRLWDRIVFNYLVGNTDGHIKNSSLLYSADLKKTRLAPAYDMVSTAVYNSSTRDMAFYIGEHCHLEDITTKDFDIAAGEAGIGINAAQKRIDRLVAGFKNALNESADILLAAGFSRAAEIRNGILANGGIGRLS